MADPNKMFRIPIRVPDAMLRKERAGVVNSERSIHFQWPEGLRNSSLHDRSPYFARRLSFSHELRPHSRIGANSNYISAEAEKNWEN